MSNISGIPSVALSRRSTLRKLVSTAGGTAIFVAAMGERCQVQAQVNKMTQKAVGYQNSPQGAQSCENCSQFVVPAACKVVEGHISPGAWCKIWAKKTT